MRCIWPDWAYSLGGEVDKRGHPIIHGGGLTNVKPDLLVHVPGQMDQNLLALEIKAGRRVASSEVKRDIEKLMEFRRRAEYAGAWFLVFGESVDQVSKIARRDQALLGGISLLELWFHPKPNSAAQRVNW